jgi:FKBP-type peptidyl-prolyl cis-trans isomerase FklB
MKKLAVLISASLLSTAVFADTDNKPVTTQATPVAAPTVDMSKVSYLIGRGMGEQLEKGKVDLDQDSFTKGLQSALAGKDSDIAKKDADTIMEAFQKEMTAKMEKLEKAKADANLKASNTFQEAISKVENIKEVPGSKGVYVQTLKEGDGQQPTIDDTVTVNYKGTTPSEAYAADTEGSLKTIEAGNLIGNEFDSSYKRNEPTTFPLSGVVKCWQEAIPQMKVGSTAIVYCSSDTAYGEQDVPNIGPNQLLSFQVELLKVDEKKADDKSEDKASKTL